MPYIRREDRAKFKELENIGLTCESSGELNYVLSMICKGYLYKFGILKYSRINDVVGALEGAKLEAYRRVASPYEDLKIKESGDVY